MIKLFFKLLNYYKSNYLQLLIVISLIITFQCISIFFYKYQKIKKTTNTSISLDKNITSSFYPRSFIIEIESFINETTFIYLETKNLKFKNLTHLKFTVENFSLNADELEAFIKKRLNLIVSSRQKYMKETDNNLVMMNKINLINEMLSSHYKLITINEEVVIVKKLSQNKLIFINLIIFSLFIFYPLIILEYRNEKSNLS